MSPRIPSLLAAAVCLLSACHKAPPPAVVPPPSEEELLTGEVNALSSEAALLLEEQHRLVWDFWTEGKAVDIAATYSGKQALFSLENLRRIDRLRHLTKDPRELRALTALHGHFAGEFLSRELAEHNDASANLEASLKLNVDGREVRYHDLERLLANEKSALKRRALYAAATPALTRLNQTLLRRETRTRELVTQMGFESYEAFGSELRQADLERLAQLAEEVLQATQEPYRLVMERLSQRELGLPFAQITRADIPRLFRSREVEDAFPKGESLAKAQATVAGLGIDLNALPNVKVDARDLPQKNPRPLALSVKVPSDVRLSFKPGTGVLHQGRVLHEVGHLLHTAFTQETRFELARLGNPTVGEAYSALFEDLLEDPVWLEENAGVLGDADKRAQYLATSSAHKLYLIRHAAGRLLYQLELHRRTDVDPRELYRALMARTGAMPMTADDVERYLVDQEDFYQSADSFRAWFLAGQLQGQLKARFGPAWWHAPEAGAFLKELWARGSAPSAREVTQAIGENGLAPDVLLLRLSTTLQVPMKLDLRRLDDTPAPAPAAPATTPASTVPQMPRADATPLAS
ncbi:MULTISPECIES: chromosome segregation protein SMC [unclassified Corallococcus]|uniref:chromosome segregation protein SMC n=1 Tax=unclassified Corallococcus TaxID=2685029 RepID=UPI001A8BFF9D|nr:MULTISPECIES: chromosome segregation protein SMC [unclassified Corallococcus]MBN9683348.1 chromosome segregation protein SMC [Corallococcus sp. NCSPR001]WAS85134.1 chromosome segregation protein SMC [Corallococcus sp. NCRR]